MAFFTDDFDRADAPTLGWIEHSASLNWGVSSNRAVTRSTFSVATLFPSPADTDALLVRGTVKALAASVFHGLVFRGPATLGSNLAGSGGFLALLISGSSQTSLAVREHLPGASGITAPLVSTVRTMLPDDVLEVQADADGATRAYVNGAHISALDFTHTDYLGQRHGGLYGSNLDVAWDDFATGDQEGAIDPPSGLTVTQEGSGLRSSWTSGESEFVLERERWTGGGTPP